jgi:hypothetical protein
MERHRPGPLLVANQSDRLGSRLCAIVNAWSLARALDARFGFVWPRNECEELHHPLEIFSPDFLEEFEIPEANFSWDLNRPALGVMTLEETRHFCEQHKNSSLVVPINFEVHAFVGENFESAHERFMRSFSEIGWSSLIREVVSGRKRYKYDALHIRAGDIVSGNWSQSMPVEKYLPTGFVEHFIAQLAGESELPLVVFSDNADYISHLLGRFDRIRTVADLVPDYEKLSEVQQAFVDIFMLSGASRLFAPVRSAFSQLAASIGGVNVQSVYESMGSADAFLILEDHLQNALSQDPSPPLQKLLARDICWMLDVFTERLTPDARLAWASRGVSCDPSFCIAKTRLAFAWLHLDCVEAAALEVKAARKLAEAVSLYQDSLTDSLACEICVAMFQLCALGSAASITNRREVHRRAEALLERCEQLYPAMIYREDLLLNLRFLVQSMRWLVTGHAALREPVVQGFQQACGAPAETLKWRRDGFTTLHTLGSAFPGLLRHVEEVSLNVSSALGQGLAMAPRRQLGRPLRCGFERVYRSQSGLRWAVGWAASRPSAGDLPIGLIRKGLAVQGGILCGQQTHRFSIPMAEGESHPLTIVVSGDGFWRQRLHDFLYKVGLVVRNTSLLLWRR